MHELPNPNEIFEAADAEAPKLNLRHYAAAMRVLRAKDYSFADVAKWMSKKLGVEITRSQVAYILTAPDGALEADEEAEDLEREADQIAEENELGDAVTHVNGRRIEE